MILIDIWRFQVYTWVELRDVMMILANSNSWIEADFLKADINDWSSVGEENQWMDCWLNVYAVFAEHNCPIHAIDVKSEEFHSIFAMSGHSMLYVCPPTMSWSDYFQTVLMPYIDTSLITLLKSLICLYSVWILINVLYWGRLSPALSTDSVHFS